MVAAAGDNHTRLEMGKGETYAVKCRGNEENYTLLSHNIYIPYILITFLIRNRMLHSIIPRILIQKTTIKISVDPDPDSFGLVDPNPEI